MKETKNLWSLWKESVQWDSKSLKQKAISAWFGLSFVALGVCGGNLVLTSIAVVNFACAAYCVSKYVPIKDDEQ